METIEKTYTKLNLKPVKDFIKAEVEKQKFYKDARKNATYTIDKNGKVTWEPMHPSIAQSKTYWQGRQLRMFYIAYAALRKMDILKVEKNYSANDPLNFVNTHLLTIAKIRDEFEEMSKIKETI